MEVRRVGVAFARAVLADLQKELAVSRELQDGVPVVTGQPHVVLPIQRDAVHGRRPLVACAGRAPMSDHVSFRVKFDDRRRLRATEFGDRARRSGRRGAATARRRRWIAHHRAKIRVDRRLATMNDPDVIAGIDGETNNRSENPVIRQLLRPHRVHLVHAGLYPLRGGPGLQHQLYGREEDDQGDHGCANIHITSALHRTSCIGHRPSSTSLNGA